MRKTTEILRLKHEVGLTHRQIARSCGLSHPTVSKYLERAQQAGLGWPLPENVDEEHLQALLFPAAEDGSRPSRPLPDMEYIHKELRRAHVTRHLLWEEYRADHADGYSYTQFCEHYRRWKAPLEVTLRQRHIAGEKTFLDWAGKTLSWTDKATGEIHPAYLFVAVLGASNYTFAETFADQQLPAWLDAHIHAVEFFGGVTKLWIPDNAKTGVHKPCYYEPQINDSYQDLADHYGTAILPTRTYAARDKAKVEHAVLNAERRIMARRRNLTFFSLGELNDAVRRCLTELNARPFQKMSGSRSVLFKELDQPVLRSLPAHRYEIGAWRQAKVNISTTTSRSTGIATRSRTPLPNSRWRCACRPAPWRSSTRAAASPLMRAAGPAMALLPIQPTAPNRSRSIWRGHRAVSSTGLAPSVRSAARR